MFMAARNAHQLERFSGDETKSTLGSFQLFGHNRPSS